MKAWDVGWVVIVAIVMMGWFLTRTRAWFFMVQLWFVMIRSLAPLRRFCSRRFYYRRAITTNNTNCASLLPTSELGTRNIYYHDQAIAPCQIDAELQRELHHMPEDVVRLVSQSVSIGFREQLVMVVVDSMMPHMIVRILTLDIPSRYQPDLVVASTPPEWKSVTSWTTRRIQCGMDIARVSDGGQLQVNKTVSTALGPRTCWTDVFLKFDVSCGMWTLEESKQAHDPYSFSSLFPAGQSFRIKVADVETPAVVICACSYKGRDYGVIRTDPPERPWSWVEFHRLPESSVWRTGEDLFFMPWSVTIPDDVHCAIAPAASVGFERDCYVCLAIWPRLSKFGLFIYDTLPRPDSGVIADAGADVGAGVGSNTLLVAVQQSLSVPMHITDLRAGIRVVNNRLFVMVNGFVEHCRERLWEWDPKAHVLAGRRCPPCACHCHAATPVLTPELACRESCCSLVRYHIL